MPDRAAGFVLFHGDGAERRYLLLQNAQHATWGFPKGVQAGGETQMGAAVRETYEETGIDEFALVPGFRREITYHPPSGRPKTAVYFVARAATPEWTRSDEHSAGEWLDADGCHERLQYHALHALLDDVGTFLDDPPTAPPLRYQGMTCVSCESGQGEGWLDVQADYGKLYRLCGGDPSQAPKQVDHYVKCNHCGLIHLTHRLDDDLWHAFTFATADPAKHAEDKPSLQAVGAHDAEVVHGYVGGGGRWLEIGSGYGYTLAAARERGVEAHGIDLAPAKIQYAHRELGVPREHLHLGDPLGLRFDSQSFDAVLCLHVIEHLPNPRMLMAQMREWVKPGGIVLMATPNAESWKARKQGADWPYATPFGHLALYDWATLTKLVEGSMLKVRERISRVAVEGPIGRAAKRALAAVFPNALSELCLVAER